VRSKVLSGWSGVPLYMVKGNRDSQTVCKLNSHLDIAVFVCFFVNTSKSCGDLKMNFGGFVMGC